MREIIFRGKRLDNGEWAEGFYISHLNACHYIIPFRTGGYEAMDNSFYVHKWFEVDPSTISQYTGLKDKNGKMIFEQDILGSRYDDLCPDDVTIEVVKWFRNGWYVQEKAYSPDLLEEYGVLPVSEIIGNAYDTPELLKEEDET